MPLVIADPGHGGRDSGAVGALNTITYKESQITRPITALFVAKLLEDGKLLAKTDFELAGKSLQTDTWPAISREVFLIRYMRNHPGEYDFFLSFHANAALEETASGLVVLHNNFESGAQIMFDSIVARVDASGLNFDIRGNRSEHLQDRQDLAVLKLGIPSLLVEVGFVSNEKDLAFLTNAAGQRALAYGAADGLYKIHNIA